MVSLEQRCTVTLTHLVSVKLFLHSIHVIWYTFLWFQRPLRLRQPVQHLMKGGGVIFPFFERAHWIPHAAGLAYKGIRPLCFKWSLNLVKQCLTLSIRRPLKLRKHQVRQRSGSYVYTALFCGQDQLLFHRVTLCLLTAYLNSGVLTPDDIRIKKLTAAEFLEVSDKGITNGSPFGRIYNKEPNKHRIRLVNFLSCRRRLKSRPIRTDLFHPECYWAYYLEIIRTRYLQHSKQVVNYGPLCERS